MQYLQGVDPASSQSGNLTVPLLAAPAVGESASLAGIPNTLLHELWTTAAAQQCGLTVNAFDEILASVGTKLNHGLPSGSFADAAQKAAFFRALHLTELALARACALGSEVAWQRFLDLYRAPLTQAAIAITGSATLGNDLADSLYGELYGLKEQKGVRTSPLSSYTGRGSLLGWLRTTLAQRYVDHHRRTRRETPLEGLEAPAPVPIVTPDAPHLEKIRRAVSSTLKALPPEDRFLLSSYFLDRRTLLEIGRLLRVHEATISRRLKRLAADLRKQLLRHLQSGGMSRRSAEEALGVDPRDIEINLRSLLQTSQTTSFSDQQATSPEGHP
jgi:RNA polymerase sigma-70 factor (ECF subfamily)